MGAQNLLIVTIYKDRFDLQERQGHEIHTKIPVI